jgi:hypothetical protein
VLSEANPGLIVMHRDGHRKFIKCRDGSWSQYNDDTVIPDSGRWNNHTFANGLYYISGSVGTGQQFESLLQYRWRFRTNAMRGAIEHQVGLDRVNSVLNRLGVGLDSDEHPLGPDVPVGNRESVPDGTLVYSGRIEDPARLSIWQWRQRQWHLVFGPGGMDTIVSIAAVPGRDNSKPPAWLTLPGTEEDVNPIKAFKARGWRLGHRLQQESSWCSTFDNIMARVGVSPASVHEAKMIGDTNGWQIGDAVGSQAEAATLPQGSVVLWTEHASGAFMFSVRDDDMTNESRCRRLVAHEVTGNFRVGAHVVYMPNPDDDSDLDWEFRVAAGWWWNRMPVGMFFKVAPGPADEYHVAHDGRIARGVHGDRSLYAIGSYDLSAFSSYHYLYLIGYAHA